MKGLSRSQPDDRTPQMVEAQILRSDWAGSDDKFYRSSTLVWLVFPCFGEGDFLLHADR